jgi:hypothetical protein
MTPRHEGEGIATIRRPDGGDSRVRRHGGGRGRLVGSKGESGLRAGCLWRRVLVECRRHDLSVDEALTPICTRAVLLAWQPSCAQISWALVVHDDGDSAPEMESEVYGRTGSAPGVGVGVQCPKKLRCSMTLKLISTNRTDPHISCIGTTAPPHLPHGCIGDNNSAHQHKNARSHFKSVPPAAGRDDFPSHTIGACPAIHSPPPPILRPCVQCALREAGRNGPTPAARGRLDTLCRQRAGHGAGGSVLEARGRAVWACRANPRHGRGTDVCDDSRC